MSRARRAAAQSLGEAGAIGDAVIAAAIVSLTHARAPRTVCPSEVARRLAADWRPLMGAVRRVAAALAEDGRIRVTQRGRPASAAAGGPIRLAAGGSGA